MSDTRKVLYSDYHAIEIHRDKVLRENERLRREFSRRMRSILDCLKPPPQPTRDTPEWHAWTLIVPLYCEAQSIAFGLGDESGAVQQSHAFIDSSINMEVPNE